MDIRIREMTGNDIERVAEIIFDAFTASAAKFGVAPRVHSRQEALAWVWTMHRHRPSRPIVAEADRRIVGFTVLHPRGDIGGCGPFVSDPHSGSRGIGGRLTSEVLKMANGLHSVRCFQEAFNPTSFSMLYSRGFLPVAHLLDLVREDASIAETYLASDVCKATKDEIDELVEYDKARSGSDRRPDLEYYVRWGKVFCYREPSRILGYLACLPGAASVQLGPLVAESEEEAGCLYRHALAVFKGKSCRTIVMAKNAELVKGLLMDGFKIYCLSNLMVHGDWRPSQCVESLSIFPEGT